MSARHVRCVMGGSRVSESYRICSGDSVRGTQASALPPLRLKCAILAVSAPGLRVETTSPGVVPEVLQFLPLGLRPLRRDLAAAGHLETVAGDLTGSPVRTAPSL